METLVFILRELPRRPGIKPQPIVNRAQAFIFCNNNKKKVRYLIKREYDRIKVFNYIFVRRFLFASFTFSSFKRVLSSIFLINTGFVRYSLRK